VGKYPVEAWWTAGVCWDLLGDMMAKTKVVRLRVENNAVHEVLNDLLDTDIKNELQGLVIIATNKNGMIHRWFFDEDRKCTNTLGMIEYMKQYIIDYMRNEQGEL